MKKFLLFTAIIFSKFSYGNFITANPSNYTSFLSSLVAGDTLFLTAGTYTNNLTLNNLTGTSSQPIVIMGSANLYTTIFQGQSCCNTVSITKCGYVVIKNLQLDGLNLAVDAVKGEGIAGNFAHHITLEYLNIINYGNNQQIVGISTKCSAWDWVIRKNKIVGAGTGMYLGNSTGEDPFVNGLIEYNLIMNTLGYNIEIKHQLDTVRDNFAGTSVNGKTILRYNVFCKENNASTGANARPNLLVGGFPLSGWGTNDYYEIYGNFFYQNPTEALFQGTGNIMLYENIFVNHVDPSGYRAVYITPQNGVSPQDIKIFHNTMWANNSSGGIRLFSPNTSYQQYCYGNAVFAPSAITNFTNTLDNVTDSYSNASTYVLSASTNLSSLDLYPASGQLTATATPNNLFQSNTDWDIDFNADLYNWTFRGAYSGCCTNNGWQLQLDTMPTHPNTLTSLYENSENDFEVNVFPNPSKNIFTVIASETKQSHIEVENIMGEKIFTSNNFQIDLSSQPCGIYFLKINSENRTVVKKIIKE
ncbi:MAG: T9SS type A sorting domain-containing protein [Bacteroidetes bacterium]|nr:T9SS type A sorting domain-containing protein [Bacteroidota bacterium]